MIFDQRFLNVFYLWGKEIQFFKRLSTHRLQQKNFTEEEVDEQGLGPVYTSSVTGIAFLEGDVRALKDKAMLYRQFVDCVSVYIGKLASQRNSKYQGFLESSSLYNMKIGCMRTKQAFATILFNNQQNGHFIVAAFTPDAKKTQVTVYDSALNVELCDPRQQLHKTFQEHLVRLFGRKNEDLKVTAVQVQQQNDGHSCGYYSIIFALALMMEVRPERLVIDEKDLSRIINSFAREGTLPELRLARTSRLTKQFTIPSSILK